nr:hypothetical protein [Tanacetum cinerariifolium]
MGNVPGQDGVLCSNDKGGGFQPERLTQDHGLFDQLDTAYVVSRIRHIGSTSTTPIVEKIDKIKRLIIKGKVTIVDDEGKPLTKVDSSGDHDSEDEVASVDNDMTNFMASKKDIPDKIQDICNNLDMKVRGRKKK